MMSAFGVEHVSKALKIDSAYIKNGHKMSQSATEELHSVLGTARHIWRASDKNTVIRGKLNRKMNMRFAEKTGSVDYRPTQRNGAYRLRSAAYPNDHTMVVRSVRKSA